MDDERNNVNREYKDRLFKLAFRGKGSRRMRRLYQKLKEDYRQEDILKAVDDAVYQNQLLEEYGL